MTPKHSIDTRSQLSSDTPHITMAQIHSRGSISYSPTSASSEIFNAENDVIQILKGNPTDQEIAAIAAIFTILATRDRHLRATIDRWPSPHPDAAMRGPFGTFIRYRTNLRWW